MNPGLLLLSYGFQNNSEATMNYPHPIIAREGWPFIAIAAVVALLIHAVAGFGLAWPFWLILIFVVQFFRDPPRPIPSQANAVLCPADGRIVAVETAHDPYAHREAPLSRGQRYGFIRFGSRVDVYLPVGSRPRVSIGEKVSASSTILAELPTQSA